ncbi:hypothetical protein [Mycobacterium botniense]|uniref:hypothetical protein n=1 Tax=Mycobacterium botniense TaxID=84962 RepID=UPI0013D4727B|nr:hypothetical protein [Mycobacterium botniense]
MDVLVDPIIASLVDAATAGAVAADAAGVGASATAAAADVGGALDPAAELDPVLAGVMNSVNTAVDGFVQGTLNGPIGGSLDQVINASSTVLLGRDVIEATGATPADAAASLQSLALPAGADPAAALGLPSLTPQIPDAFLEFVKDCDGYAFTVEDDGLLYENYDIIGTIAMQINAGLASNPVDSVAVNGFFTQILDHDWTYTVLGIPVPVTTNFFEEFVIKEMNPDAFTSSGLPANPGNPVETIAYQLDNLLANTVYAVDLNLAEVFLWG